MDVVAEHAGSIKHIHNFQFNSQAVEIAKEARNIVLILASAWIIVESVQVFRSYKRERAEDIR